MTKPDELNEEGDEFPTRATEERGGEEGEEEEEERDLHEEASEPIEEDEAGPPGGFHLEADIRVISRHPKIGIKKRSKAVLRKS